MTGEQEYYGSTARHYDPAYAAAAPEGDAEFYKDLALRQGGPVLEIGCGTGRILIPIAEAGIEIDGLDFTPQLLEIARAKLARLPESVAKRISLHQGDMRGFCIERTYRLVTVPFRPLQHLLSIDDQIAALTSIRRHLAPGGVLAFNVFYPDYRLFDQPAEEREEMSWRDPENPDVTVKRFFRRKSFDRLRQFFEAEFVYRSFENSKLIGEQRSALRMSYYTYPHIQLLLRHTGFEIVEEYGSFRREPIDICREMIVAARAIA